jgi:hypothetical protein
MYALAAWSCGIVSTSEHMGCEIESRLSTGGLEKMFFLNYLFFLKYTQ